jgi:hypothetical protein
MLWYIDVFGSTVNLALKNWAPVGEGVGEGKNGAVVGINVEVGDETGAVGVGISGVGGVGLSTSI